MLVNERVAESIGLDNASKHTASGPRAVRRRRDFWYSSMSDGAAPSSGLAQSLAQATSR
jgi:hypothetical protein